MTEHGIMNLVNIGSNNRLLPDMNTFENVISKLATILFKRPCIKKHLSTHPQMEEIVNRHGLVVISRAGSNPEQFIYETDMLYKNQVSALV